ncbi:hypothetical protein Ga0609869_002995 [Rhodovulum iodosum]|uniref:DUF2029 domain-containing protein n=1 Tax=Rhodovulum iodosum TaxID=68291 RepID=A0ABV3XZ61_9RHOB|nr:glycosyltransferase family 87 protein [Rhodovulum robiginosum]RSK36772.1 DUF2029 domain-containing protein [Rhodovulum robiginosum]
MSRPNPFILTAFLLAVVTILGGLPLLQGALFIGKHEGDMMHLLDIVFRIADGQWPHRDFMTPIGYLAFAPIALFVKLGYGVGHAILYSQVLVAAILLPVTVWVAVTRIPGRWAYLFGFVVMVFCLALVHGEAERSISISMHYNRWAWAVSFLVLTAALLPARGRARAAVDGPIIGLGLAALALTKITFFAGFAVPVALALAIRRDWRALRLAVFAGLAVVAVVTLLAGPLYWPAYIRDLLTVAGSELRPSPGGVSFRAMIGAPAFVGGNLLLIYAAILLREMRHDLLGLVVLLLVPGFYFVTHQNYGNDPKWLLLLGILLFISRTPGAAPPEKGIDRNQVALVVGTALLAFIFPSLVNMTLSPLRQGNTVVSEYAPLLGGEAPHDDLFAAKSRAYLIRKQAPVDMRDGGLDRFSDMVERPEPAQLLGEELPDCELYTGLIGWYANVAADLEEAGYAGARFFNADVLNPYWLFADFRPLAHGAPWHYDGLPGIEGADYLVVPVCPVKQKQRKRILDLIAETPLELHEAHRTDHYILLELDGQAGG